MSYTLHTTDINSLIYQYFLERGLHHSAFLLKQEANDITTNFPSGSLVSYLEKSLLFEELQHHLRETEFLTNNTQRCSNPVTLTHPHLCSYSTSPVSANGLSPELFNFFLLPEHTSSISSITSQKNYLISGSKDGTVRKWRLKQEPPFYEISSSFQPVLLSKPLSPVKHLDISQTGSVLCLLTEGTVIIWSSVGLLIKTIQDSFPISSAEWDQSGQFILTATPSGVDLWNKEGLHEKSFRNEAVQDVISASSRWDQEFSVLTSSAVFVWKDKKGPVKLCQRAVNSCKWSPSKSYLAIGDTDLEVYHDKTGFWWVGRGIDCYGFLRKKESIATCSGGEVTIWDMEKRTVSGIVKLEIGKGLNVVFSKDDKWLAVKGEDKLQIMEMSEEVVRLIKLPGRAVDVLWLDDSIGVAIGYLTEIAVYKMTPNKPHS